MTVNPGEPNRTVKLDSRYDLGTGTGLRFIDLLPAIMLSVVILLMGLFVSTGPDQTVSFFETTPAKTAILITSALLTAATFYFIFRLAQRTAERQVMRVQSDAMLARLDALEDQLDQKDIKYL